MKPDTSLAGSAAGGFTVHICSFSACPPVKNKTTYEGFREGVLAAGRFSVFEATETRRSARMFDRLCKDPWIDTDISCGYPWTLVTRRDTPKPEFVDIIRCPICGEEGTRLPCRHRVAVFVRQQPIEPTESNPALGPEARDASNEKETPDAK